MNIELLQATYKWLCAYCMEELAGIDPDMEWPGYKPGTCERCKRNLIIFTTEEK